MSKSTLSSVVSSLVRASMGSAVSSTVRDEDLDKHVAELILKEAKQKADNYGKLGIKAYLPSGPDPNAPRPNKRFLSSIIRSTDDHNKTILRAQALAAEEIKRERDEQERRERRARAEEAAAAERSRRRRRTDVYHSAEWATGRARDRERSRPHAREWDSDWRSVRTGHDPSEDGEREHRQRHGSRSGLHPERDRGRDRKHESSHKRTLSKDSRRSERDRRKRRRHDSRDNEKDHKRRRQSSRSASPAADQNQPAPQKTSRTASPSEDQCSRRRKRKAVQDSALRNMLSPSLSSQTVIEGDATEIDSDSRRALKGKERETGAISLPVSPPRVRSPSRQPAPAPRRLRGRPTSSTSVRSPSVSPPPLPPAALPSKMDRYFEDSYDPRLDVAPLSIPTVPETGLINESEFEAWDAMLELLRQRREDKEEKKRLEKLGFDTSDKKIPTVKLKKHSEGGDSIMEIEYKKKGSVREWDLGKEGF